MRRPVMVLVALAWATVLSGCPDWSRPDPALKREVVPAPVAPATPEVPTTVAPQAADLGALRDGVGRLRADPAQPAALEELERLESLGFDLLERGSVTEQTEAESLLQELSDLRADLVERARGK